MSILPFASEPHDSLTPLSNDIHAAVWDRVGLAKVQGFVRQWAADWKARSDRTREAREKAWAANEKGEAVPVPDLPELPLPPSHRERSPSEKWAALAAVHDVYWLGAKILPWPVPDDEHLAAWFRGDGGAFMSLMECAGSLTGTEAEYVDRWLREAVLEGKDQGGGKHPWGDDDPETLLSPATLADRLRIPESDSRQRERLRSRLRTWRDANRDGGWIEVADRKPQQAGYLYPIGKVWTVVEDLKRSG